MVPLKCESLVVVGVASPQQIRVLPSQSASFPGVCHWYQSYPGPLPTATINTTSLLPGLPCQQNLAHLVRAPETAFWDQEACWTQLLTQLMG